MEVGLNYWHSAWLTMWLVHDMQTQCAQLVVSYCAESPEKVFFSCYLHSA